MTKAKKTAENNKQPYFENKGVDFPVVIYSPDEAFFGPFHNKDEVDEFLKEVVYEDPWFIFSLSKPKQVKPNPAYRVEDASMGDIFK